MKVTEIAVTPQKLYPKKKSHHADIVQIQRPLFRFPDVCWKTSLTPLVVLVGLLVG